MKRFEQILLITTFVGFSWLAMQAVHELGHVVGAWVTGGRVERVVLHPAVFSQTDLAANPHPLLVVWAGPVVGVVLPLCVFLLAQAYRAPGVYLFRWFAGFCLIANGVYIAFGPSHGGADSGVMTAHGTARGVMVLFGLATVPLGLYLWHRQGPHFGLGPSQGQVNRTATVASTLLLLAVVAVELLINSR
ncbi:MAG: M50 family metallopeptidase [Pirellulales bacterium]|nr:M50 family metallopeptidase [Pirellulales bacterium]